MSASQDPAVLTVPGLLASLAQTHPAEVALRHKQYGLWNEVSYAEYLEQVQVTALGLRALGLERGERVAIICENTPLWLYAQLGVQAAGGVSVGIYPSMTTREVAEVLALTGANWAIVQGEEQVDKLLELQAAHPPKHLLRRVVYGQGRGMRKHAGNGLLLTFETLGQLGREQHDGSFGALLTQGGPDDLAHLTLSSGTSSDTPTGRAVTVTHRQLLSLGHALLEVDPIRPGDDYLSFLPLAWSGEQIMSVSVALQSRLTVNFPESSETALVDLAELGPHVMYTPPRIWEDLRTTLLRRMNGSYRLNRAVSGAVLRGSQRAASAQLGGQPLSAGGRLSRRFAGLLLTRPVLDRTGLLRLRRAYVTGSALSPELTSFFHALGVNLKAAYGQAESLGLSHVQRDGEVRNGTVGQALPGAETRLTDSGELLLRAPWQSSGYYSDEAASAVRWQDGWLHSGDVAQYGGAQLSPGAGQGNSTQSSSAQNNSAQGEHLSVRGRADELCRTLGGQLVEPQRSENRLKLSPYIREALVLAQDQDAPTALLALDAGAVGGWAEGQRLAYSTFADLSQRPEVAALIRAEVQAANADLSSEQQISRFALLYKPLDADDGELTRTGTVRRSVLLSRFAPLVAGLKRGDSRVALNAEVEYGDGQKTTQELTITLHHLGVSSVPDHSAAPAARSFA